MPARMPVLRQHDVRKSGRQAVDQRHDLVAARHRQAPPGQKSFWMSTTSSTSLLADGHVFFHDGHLSLLHQPAIDLGGEFDQRIRDVNRIGGIRFEFAQRLGQPLQFALRPAPGFRPALEPGGGGGRLA